MSLMMYRIVYHRQLDKSSSVSFRSGQSNDGLMQLRMALPTALCLNDMALSVSMQSGKQQEKSVRGYGKPIRVVVKVDKKRHLIKKKYKKVQKPFILIINSTFEVNQKRFFLILIMVEVNNKYDSDE